MIELSKISLKSEIEALTAQILDRSKVVPMDYVFSVIARGARNVSDCFFFLRSPKLFRTPDEVRPDFPFLILPYLSFQIEEGTFRRFPTANSGYEAYEQAKTLNRIIDSPFLAVLARRDQASADSEELLLALARLMEAYFHFYEYPQILGRSASRYAKLLAEGEQPPTSFLSILDRISSDYHASIAYIGNVDGKLTLLHGECPIDILGSRPVTERYRYAVTRSQVASSFFEANGFKYFFTLVPHVEHLPDANLPPGCVMVLSQGEPLDEQLIAFISYFIARAFRERARSGQSRAIDHLSEVQRRILEQIRIGQINTHSSRLSILKEELDAACRLLADVTGAHSVTVRLHNRFSNTLNVFASHDRTSMDIEQRRIISVSNYEKSLNAAVFRLRTPSSPVRIDDIDAPLIPDDLKQIGFSGPLNLRPGTASEICAALWSADTPIGTINLESPEKRGFRNDDLFIGTVAREVGDLFSLTHEALSLPTIMQLARANDAAHGAAGLDFDAVLKSISPQLRDSLPKPLVDAVKGFEEFRQSYRRDILEVGGRATALSSVAQSMRSIYEKCLVPMVSEDPAAKFSIEYEEREIATPLAHSLVHLVELIFKNAAKHSRIDLDEISISIGPTAFGLKRWLFDLHYRSIHAIDPEVLDSFGLTPIRKDGDMRYGAFLLGYQARALGGILDVKRAEGSKLPVPLEFQVSIPLGFEP